MTCGACRRANLPGGVRCTYCGVHYPAGLDFDVGEPRPDRPQQEAPDDAPERSAAPGVGAAGLLGTLLLLALKGKSLLTLLKLGKLATTLGSMFVFIVADARFFGWQFAVGIALSIFVHEMGHVFVNWRKGLKQSAPMFIPFLGAVIFVKRYPDDPEAQAESGAGGPTAGMLAALACLGIAVASGNRFWLALAHIGFVINLFNLIPVWQLDGAHMATVFSPAVWNGVLLVLLLCALKASATILWLILLIAFLVRLTRGSDDRWILAPAATRWRIAALYLVLCTGLSYGIQQTVNVRPGVHRQASGRTQGASGPLEQEARRPSRPEPVGATLSPEHQDSADTPQLRLFASIVLAFLLGVPPVLWLGASVLLRKAAQRRVTITALVLPVWASCCTAAALFIHRALAPEGHSHGPAVGVHWAAAGAALLYALIAAVTTRPDRPPLGLAQGTTRALVWALGGALAVVYASEDLVLLAVVAAACAAFMFRYRWALPAALAGVRQELGDLEGAIGLWQRAADLRPDPETEASLLTTIARAELALKRGQPALDALERRRALASALAPRAPVVRSMGDLALEASALATLERFDEAVARCEEILAVTVHEEASRARRLTVHACLADLARIRGWADEALAQAEWCLAAVPQKARRARGVLRALRAATLADQARFEDAVAEAGRAAKAARDPAVEAQVCIVRARVNLDARRPGDALRHLIRADHLRAGSLETAYWLGVALRATDDAAGVERLRDLADRHPAEHWGRRAAASLA